MECKPEMIAGNKDAYVVRCKHCQKITFCYKNLIFRFEPEDFRQFTQSLGRANFEESAVSFPDQKKYILVNADHKDIQVRFNKQEFEQIKDLLQPVMLMMETWDILGLPEA